MKQIVRALIFLFIIAIASAVAQTTPNIHLNVPSHGAQNWDTLVNPNWYNLDNIFGGSTVVPGINVTSATFGSATATGSITATGGFYAGSSSNFLGSMTGGYKWQPATNYYLGFTTATDTWCFNVPAGCALSVNSSGQVTHNYTTNFVGEVTGPTPVNPSDLTTKSYVDSLGGGGGGAATGFQMLSSDPTTYSAGGVWFNSTYKAFTGALSSSAYQRLATFGILTGYNYWESNYLGNLVAQADSGVTVHAVGIVIGDSTVAGSNTPNAPSTNNVTSWVQSIATTGTTPKLAEAIQARFGSHNALSGFGGEGWIPTFVQLTSGGQGTPLNTSVSITSAPHIVQSGHDGTASFCPDDTVSEDDTLNDVVSYTASNTTNLTFYALAQVNGGTFDIAIDTGSYSGTNTSTAGSGYASTMISRSSGALSEGQHTIYVKVTGLGSGGKGVAFCGVRTQDTTQSATFEMEKWGSGGAELNNWNAIPNTVLSALGLDPAFVAIETGPNEWVNNNRTPAQVASDLATTKAKINTVWPNASVLYVSSQKDYRSSPSNLAGSFGAYAQAIRDEANLDNVTLIDLYSETANGTQLANWSLCPYAGASAGACSGVHMNDPGNVMLANWAYFGFTNGLRLNSGTSNGSIPFGQLTTGTNSQAIMSLGLGARLDLSAGCDPGTCFRLPMSSTEWPIQGGYLAYDSTNGVRQLIYGRDTASSWRVPYYGQTQPQSGDCANWSANGQINDSGGPCSTLNSPAFTGTPTAPTASPGTSTTQLATTAFVQNAVAGAGGSSDIVPADVTVTYSSGQSTGCAVTQNIVQPTSATAYSCKFVVAQTTADAGCTTHGTLGVQLNWTDNFSSAVVSGANNVGLRTAINASWTTAAAATVTAASTLGNSTVYYSVGPHTFYDAANAQVSYCANVAAAAVGCTTYPVFKIHAICTPN